MARSSFPEKKASDLVESGRAALADRRLARAKRIGNRLLGLGYSGGFELLARAAELEEKPRKAIRILKAGLRDAPDSWALWLMLGNLYSDRERHERSSECFRRAQTCPGVDADLVHLNAATALGRAKQYTEAVLELDRIAGNHLLTRVIPLRMHLLNSAGRHTDALAYGEDAMAKTRFGKGLAVLEASVLEELATAAWKGAHDSTRALDYAWKAIQLDKGSSAAMWVVREAANLVGTKTRIFDVLVRGRWHAPILNAKRPPRFLASYVVAAESKREALQLIAPFEPEAVRASLRVEQITAIGKAAKRSKGVYAADPGYFFFSGKKN
ncbi:MAG: tetratricopeptide repeat protein [Candidatus Schekmanbacteria bacterium]|nr:tetratricopeptide repeat protein [Candidatus Schekmanbacteria bacterium]